MAVETTGSECWRLKLCFVDAFVYGYDSGSRLDGFLAIFCMKTAKTGGAFVEC